MTTEALPQNGDKAGEKIPLPKIEIVYDGDMVHVNGPLDNMVLCYGMLEMAKQIIAVHNAQKQSRLLKPGGLHQA